LIFFTNASAKFFWRADVSPLPTPALATSSLLTSLIYLERFWIRSVSDMVNQTTNETTAESIKSNELLVTAEPAYMCLAFIAVTSVRQM